jgi:hypothetical protein
MLPPGVNQMCDVLLPPGVNQMCDVLLIPGVNPTAVKLYIYIYISCICLFYQTLTKPLRTLCTTYVSSHPLLSNQSIHLQKTDTKDRPTSVQSAARSTDSVDIASGTVLPVAQWTWYVQAASGSGQRGRTDGKCWFVGGFVLSTVHKMLLRLPNKGKGDG